MSDVKSNALLDMNSGRSNNRYDTEDNWALANPVLQRGEIGFAKTAGGIGMKVGDGKTPWNSLPYLVGG